MRKLISLIVQDNNLKAVEIVKKGKYLYLKDKDALSFKQRKSPSYVVATLTSPVFVKSFSLRKELQRDKKGFEEAVSKNLGFPLKESFWDYSYLEDKFTFFVVKSREVEKVISFLASLNCKPVLLTPKVCALYNYFVFNHKNLDSFFLLYLEESCFSSLIFQKGKFFFSETPFRNPDISQNLELMVSELNRLRDYLQSKGFFTGEVFSSFFACGREEEVFLDRLSKSLGSSITFLKPRDNIRWEQSVSLNPHSVLLLGAGLGSLEPKLLKVNFLKKELQQQKIRAVRENVQKIVLRLGVLILIALWGSNIFLTRSFFKNRGLLKNKEEIFLEVLPVYKHLVSQRDTLNSYIEPLQKRLIQNKFLIESIEAVGNSLGKVELVSFNFWAEESRIEALLKAKNYEEVSGFLKKLRESPSLERVELLSSSLQQEEKEEFVYFRIRAFNKSEAGFPERRRF